MARRTRFIPGLIALLAMTFSLVEGVWASTCAPGMEMERAEMAGAMASADEAMPDMPADHDCIPGHEHGEHQGDEHGAPCPFGPAGMLQGCAAAASLPAVNDEMTLPSPEGPALSPTVETSPHLLWVASIFHPPKA